jgi:hypothetical protein
LYPPRAPTDVLMFPEQHFSRGVRKFPNSPEELLFGTLLPSTAHAARTNTIKFTIRRTPMDEKKHDDGGGNVCSICQGQFEDDDFGYGLGNNPWPIAADGQCCDDCNARTVFPARLKEYNRIVNNN